MGKYYNSTLLKKKKKKICFSDWVVCFHLPLFTVTNQKVVGVNYASIVICNHGGEPCCFWVCSTLLHSSRQQGGDELYRSLTRCWTSKSSQYEIYKDLLDIRPDAATISYIYLIFSRVFLLRGKKIREVNISNAFNHLHLLLPRCAE